MRAYVVCVGTHKFQATFVNISKTKYGVVHANMHIPSKKRRLFIVAVCFWYKGLVRGPTPKEKQDCACNSFCLTNSGNQL